MQPINNTTQAQAQAQVQPQPQNQQEAIDEFVKLADTKLDSDGITQWVDKHEVVDVNNALVALAKDHGSDAADAALDKLSDKGLLQTFVNEMYGAGRGGSVSKDDQATIFSNVARYADGETLANFAQAVESSTNGVDGYNRQQDFADAVATHASPQAKIDFIKTFATETTQGRDADYTSSFGGGSSSIEGDSEAAAVATVLGSLKGANFQEAFDSLSSEQLGAVVNSSIEEKWSTSGSLGGSSHTVGSFDASNFSNLADAVTEHGTVEQKAQVFNIGGLRVDSIADAGNFATTELGNTQAAADITDGLTNILSSDTNGVISELTFDNSSQNGQALTNYVEQLIETGQTDEVASIQAQLLVGNDGKGNQEDRFNQIVDNEDHNEVAVNASKLGYFAGAVQNAVDNVEATANEKKDLVQDIIGTTFGILSGSVGLAFPKAGFAIGLAGEGANRIAEIVLRAPNATIDDIIFNSSIPIDPETEKQTASGDAFAQFQARVSFVQNGN